MKAAAEAAKPSTSNDCFMVYINCTADSKGCLGCLMAGCVPGGVR